MIQVQCTLRSLLIADSPPTQGLFLAEAAGAGDLIGEYTGEIITSAEADRRGVFYDEVFDVSTRALRATLHCDPVIESDLCHLQRSYLFGVEDDVCLDAQYVGCKVRIGKIPRC